MSGLLLSRDSGSQLRPAGPPSESLFHVSAYARYANQRQHFSTCTRRSDSEKSRDWNYTYCGTMTIIYLFDELYFQHAMSLAFVQQQHYETAFDRRRTYWRRQVTGKVSGDNALSWPRPLTAHILKAFALIIHSLKPLKRLPDGSTDDDRPRLNQTVLSVPARLRE